MKRLATGLLILTLLILTSKALWSYDSETHGLIAEQAALPAVSSVGRVLEEDLGLSAGINQQFFGKAVQRIIGDGARFEDEPSRRVLNHFHNPLQPWAQAGLTLPLRGQVGQSSVLWGQHANQTPGGQWSWGDARRHYVDALTAQSISQRERSFADLFRGLGQVTHLVQDATVPAHVRNDPHLSLPIPFTDMFIPFNPDWYEDWAERRRNTVIEFINLAPVKPPLSIFSPTGDTQAPVPFARLIDTDRFQDGDFSILSDPGLGASEYTNGNFLSRDRIFRGFTFPRTDSLDLANPLVLPEGTRWRRYYSKVREGAIVNRFVAEGMLFRSLQAASTAPPPSGGWIMDDRVQEDYARLLLPRAVGYSASLLDYFFRGKLNVDLSTDEADASLVRVEGVNRSTEKLDGGTLMLYGDDASGNRSAATPVGSTAIFADPGQRISATFRLPPNSEKLIAVYKGKLGNEVPQGDFPGGVIGKVIGRERVEQIFTDFNRWYIRNSQGVFPLPILWPDVDDLQWGDDDNTMVGRSRIGPGQLNKFYSYRINRLIGATHLPLTIDQIVDMQQTQEFSFPMAASVGTTVSFSHTVPYKQYLLWANTVSVQNWVQTDPDNPDTGHYESAGPAQTTYGISLLVNESSSTSLNYSIVLDENSHVFSPFSAQYIWDIRNIHLTSDGRPLALVQVQFTTNNLGNATFPSRTLGRVGDDGGSPPTIVDLSTVQLPFALPELGPMWVLIDISTGEILANTAPPTLLMNHENGRTSYGPNPNATPPIRHLSRIQFNGGPQDGFRYVSVADVPLATHPVNCSPVRLSEMSVLASETTSPAHVQTILTQNRSEIAEIEFGSIPNSPESIINFPVSCGNSETPPSGFRITVLSGPSFAPNNIGSLIRTLSAEASEQMVFLMTQAQSTSSRSNLGKIATWNPAQARLELHQQFLDQGSHLLWSASRDAGLVITTAPGPFTNSQTRLVGFSSGSLTAFPAQQLFDYVLLDPEFFYNMFDFKFHRKDPSLETTGLPAELATTSLPRNPLGRYHVVAIK